jgi:hypothetical protein
MSSADIQPAFKRHAHQLCQIRTTIKLQRDEAKSIREQDKLLSGLVQTYIEKNKLPPVSTSTHRLCVTERTKGPKFDLAFVADCLRKFLSENKEFRLEDNTHVDEIIRFIEAEKTNPDLQTRSSSLRITALKSKKSDTQVDLGLDMVGNFGDDATPTPSKRPPRKTSNPKKRKRSSDDERDMHHGQTTESEDELASQEGLGDEPTARRLDLVSNIV